MDFKDYYASLGVSPDADDKTIKKAYQKLAKKYHPDVNPGDKNAEEKFKEATEAYQAISDPEKRRKYDELRQDYQQWKARGGRGSYNWDRWQSNPGGGGGGFSYTMSPEDFAEIFGGTGGAGGFNFGGERYSDFFSTLFGGIGGQGRGFGGGPNVGRPRQGQDVEVEVQVTLEESYTGTTRVIRTGEKQIEAKIPKGVEITARTTEGVDLARTWRTDAGTLGGLTAARITDRVRWQLEGWLSGGGQGPLTRIGLAAQDLAPAGVHQGGLWGADAGGQVRARRALERVQGLLGVESVLGVQLQGGREVRDQVHLVPWGSVDVAQRTRDLPWPGRLPEPAPARVLTEPRPVRLLTGDSAPVRVDRRLALSGDPAVLEHDDAQQHLDGWAGPWPVAQRWWRSDASRAVYLQVLAPSGALLVSCRRDEWFLEAHYD